MIIYVRKDLVSLDIQLINVKKSFNDSDKFTDFGVLVENINKFISNFNTIKTFLGTIETIETIDTDEKYKLLLSKYFLLVPIFLLIKGVNQNIINNFNNVNDDYIKKTFLKNYINIENPEKFISEQNKILDNLKITGDENEKKTNRDIGFKIQSDFSKLKSYYNELKNSNILFTKINSFFTFDIENQNKTLDELYKIIPKKIVDHIKCCEPFKHAIQTMSEPRNHNAFIERSTQYFGTNTVIIPIFESLSNSIENNIEKIFVEKIKDTITSIKTIANSNENISFLKLLEITNKELEKLHNYKPPLKYLNDDEDNRLKTQILEKNAELNMLTGELKNLNSVDQTSLNLDEKIEHNKNIQTKIPVIKNLTKEIQTVERKRNDYETFFNNHNLLIPKDKIITPNLINTLITKLKNKILIEQYLNEIISSFNNIGTPSNIIPSIQTNSVTNNVIEDNPDKANEIEIFLKGFLGCMIFLKYNEKKGLSVPTILKKKTGGQTEYQDTIITEFIKIAYNLLFNSDDYDSNNNNDELYPQDNIVYKNLKGIIVRKKIDKTYDIRTSNNERHNNIKRSDIKKIFLDKKDDIIIFSQDDINEFSEEEKKNITKDYSKNEYDENAFKKLIDMNSISFDEKPLSGEYEGFNANQFNFNKTLLLYLEYRINTLNNISENNQSRPPELYGMNELFKQLFEGTGITITTRGGNPKEAILTLNPMISEIFNSFFDDNNVVKYDKIQTFKQNLNFMLNMPTVNEIITVIQLENDVEETKLNNYNDNKGSDYYKDFRDLFDRAHPDMIRKINSVYNSIVQEKQVTIFKPVSMRTGTNLSNKDLNIPEQKQLPTSVFSFGGKKTRRYNKKISRNYRIKKNKTNRRRNNKKTRKS
jgi:hypothetical protein